MGRATDLGVASQVLEVPEVVARLGAHLRGGARRRERAAVRLGRLREPAAAVGQGGALHGQLAAQRRVHERGRPLEVTGRGHRASAVVPHDPPHEQGLAHERRRPLASGDVQRLVQRGLRGAMVPERAASSGGRDEAQHAGRLVADRYGLGHQRGAVAEHGGGVSAGADDERARAYHQLDRRLYAHVPIRLACWRG